MNMPSIIIENIDKKNVRFIFTNGSLEVYIRHGDLSQESCDAVVNPTNVSMVPDGGLDAHVHREMGQFFTDQVVAIHKEMKENSCPVGQSRIFIAKSNREESDAMYVISTVGPNYSENEKERACFLLRSCYYTSLALANLYQLSSIAYPAISCGAHHFPAEEAARVAIDAVRQFSFNVKDIRFVLFDGIVYEIFVREWTEYAQKINQDANADYQSEQTISTTITNNEQSNRYCILCKKDELSFDRQYLCVQCSELSRPEIFNNFLLRLRLSGDKSYDDLFNECQLLEPILKLYPLVYTPAQTFDQSIHNRDSIAEFFLQSHCDKRFRYGMPMAVLGDGNCFYNTFVKLGGTGTTTDVSTLTPVELRARNVVEFVLNANTYKSKYDDIASILDRFEDYATKEMVRDTNYTAPWDLFSIPTILNINLISIYPKVNGDEDLHYQLLNGIEFIPLTSDDDDDETTQTDVSKIRPTVKLLFSNCNKPISFSKKKSREWSPNHFVPVLNFGTV